MTWIVVVGLAGIVFIGAAWLIRLPRQGYSLFAAALLFGLAGYAMQGSPDLPAAPREGRATASPNGAFLVQARREFFGSGQAPSRFVITSDAFTRRGQYDDAANFLRNAVAENPGDAEAWLALGNALVEHADGQLTPASLHAYSRAEALLPSNPAPTYFLGLALIRAGRAEEARSLWVEALSAAPANAPWREAFAQRLERLDALLEAARAAQSSQSVGPGQ